MLNLDGFKIDFEQGQLRYRLKKLQGRNELIAKAIGWKKGIPFEVLDATAGLGREAFLLAALGCKVTMTERHPVIAALLQDALNSAKLNNTLLPIIDRMALFAVCAIQYLQANPNYLPDVIYCDPMFPLRTKTALVKKELQMLQHIVGTDSDAEKLVAIALARAQKRVVVKRPLNGDILYSTPTMSFKARSHRFDIYITLTHKHNLL
ncbi:MAG: class I SAM-dependent methyltransferase [Proteobacteria bacterium]|nr:class I SAM-dependent methyltransferase [Pseudomonadota bacterium]